MSVDLSWTKFYMEFADNLTNCKNNRKPLMDKIHEIHKDMGFGDMIDKFKDGTSGLKQDICPFTAMSEFNRNLTRENRIGVESRLAEFLDVSTTPPKIWPGIPVLPSMGRWFYQHHRDRKQDHIDKLWDVFMNSLEYADKKSNRSQFIESFDAVLERGTSIGYLTIGLFWIRPYVFLPLDSSTRNYLEEKYNVQDLKPTNCEEYLKIVEKIRTMKQISESTFPKLSDAAYVYLQNSSKFQFTKKDFDSQTGKEKDAKYLKERFDQLQTKLEKSLSNNFKKSEMYVAQPFTGSKNDIVKWKDNMWLGLVTDSAFYDRTQESIQFRVSLKHNLFCHIWASWVAKNRISIIINQYKQNPEQFLEILKDLPKNYTIKVYTQNDTPEYSLDSNISREKLDDLFDHLEHKNAEFHLGVSWDKNTVLDMKENVINELANTFDKLLPAYRFLNEVNKTEKLPIPEFDKYKESLHKKHQIIFYGPPGTGKTYIANKLASHITNNVRHVTFHPSYSYEEFVEGIKPDKDGNFDIKDGIFKQICNDAKNSDKKHVLVIDEINRGRTEKIFGELITLIESDKRGKHPTHLAYSQDEFTVPKNLLLVGTMNTADRSLTYLDAALRRRFRFFELLPDYSLIKNTINGISIDELLKILNSKIREYEGREKQIGHSYFMSNGKPIQNIDELYHIFYYDIIPLLQDYFYEDYDKLNLILDDEIINKETMEIIYLPKSEFEKSIKKIINGNKNS